MREFTDVGAGDEGLVARAGEDHAVHGRVGLCILECSLQIGPGRRVERVEHLGPIDRHVGDRTLFLVLDVRKRQRRPGQGVGCCCRRRGERCSSRNHSHISWMGGSRRRSAGAAEMSHEGAVTGDGFADDQILHLIGAFVGVQRLGIVEEARDIVVGDDAVAAQDLASP